MENISLLSVAEVAFPSSIIIVQHIGVLLVYNSIVFRATFLGAPPNSNLGFQSLNLLFFTSWYFAAISPIIISEDASEDVIVKTWKEGVSYP